MKNRARVVLSLAAALLGAATASADAGSPWRDFQESALRAGGERVLFPVRYRAVRLDRDALLETLAQAPLEFTADASYSASAVYVRLPMPDGSDQRFRVEESPIMEPGLAAKFPEIKTWRGQGMDDPTASARFGWTAAGFHAIVLSERGTVYVDPYRRGDTEHYLSFYKRDYRAPQGDSFRCLLDEIEQSAFSGPEPLPAFAPSGDTLRTYRLALATTVEYSDFHSNQTPPSKTDVMNNGLVPTMNRVNGVYERDVALRMVMVANNDLVIFVVEPDPYTNNNGGAMLGQNQTTLDNLIGSANYDIGHVFSTGGGGVASLRVPCINGSKARGVTGRGQPIGDPFDIDYVAHEMGHQWGGNHTFNGNAGSCNGNGNSSTAYEVGSGSTIQAYAGICSNQDLQPNSDDYFHNISFVEIQAYSQNGNGNNCAVRTPTGNQAPVIDAGPAFTIPSRTPFALTATGSDPDGHPLTFCWEEMDLGPPGDGRTDNGSSPILRSFTGTSSPTRTFPKLSDLLGNVVTYGEILPTTTRVMNFRVTARDNRAGGGGVEWDATTVSVQSGAGPFRVAAPNTNVVWASGGTETVAWDVANTTAPPVSAANVSILLSTDGGLTFPTTLLASTPNDGTQTVSVPPVTTTTARVKVQAVGNIFFDVSDANFRILNCVAITLNPATLPAGTAGAPYSQTFTQTGGTNVTWSVSGTLPAGITLNPSTGVLSGTPTVTGSFPITVTATEPGGCSGSRSYTLVINCQTITVNPPTIPPATTGAPYSQAFTHVTGLGTVVWSLTGTLPAGLTFNTTTGILSGTPTQTGSFPFTVTATDSNSCAGSRAYTLVVSIPAQAAAPMALSIDFGGNGVLQPGETAGMRPTWQNVGSGVLNNATGALSSFTGPAGPAYNIPDASASYGTIAVGGSASCSTNCYALNIPAATRPAQHWDATVVETFTPSGNTKTWTLHVGESFSDVAASSPFFRFVETLLHKGVTGGCTTSAYCPTASTTREQLAVFVLVAKEAPGYSPAACVAGSEMFADVPASIPFCRWIEEMARRGAIAGCGGGNYCPLATSTREQMAVFVLRILDPTLNPPACAAPTMFADVPATSPFCRWIEELARRGVVAGCGGGNYCPTANVSRDQMSVFLSVTFGLTLYGL